MTLHTTAEVLAAAVLAVLVQLLPPDRTAALHARQYPASAETGDERAARYASVARDLADVALEPADGAHVSHAALLAAVAVRESRLDPDVDRQRCSDERVRLPGANCDGGRSGTIFQLRPAPETRERAARRALRGMRGGQRQCGHLGGWFLGRGCDDARGRDLSRDRMALAAEVEARMRSALRAGGPAPRR